MSSDDRAQILAGHLSCKLGSFEQAIVRARLAVLPRPRVFRRPSLCIRWV